MWWCDSCVVVCELCELCEMWWCVSLDPRPIKNTAVSIAWVIVRMR